MKETKGSRLFTIIFAVLFLAMAVELVLLIRQNRGLKQTIAELQARHASAREEIPTLEEGETVEPLSLIDLDGKPANVGYDDPERDSLLLIFSPDCPACKENMAGWKVVEQADVEQARKLYFISTAGEERTRQFVEEYALDRPVFLAGADALSGYKVAYIPTTLLIGPGGVVKRVWVGVLSEDALEELQQTSGA